MWCWSAKTRNGTSVRGSGFPFPLAFDEREVVLLLFPFVVALVGVEEWGQDASMLFRKHLHLLSRQILLAWIRCIDLFAGVNMGFFKPSFKRLRIGIE